MAPEQEKPYEETPNTFSTDTELAPDDTPEASGTVNKAAAGAEPGAAEAAAAEFAAGGEDSAQVQTHSEGKVCSRNV